MRSRAISSMAGVRTLACLLFVLLPGVLLPRTLAAGPKAPGDRGDDGSSFQLRFVPGTTTDMTWDAVPEAESYGLYRGRILPGRDFWAFYHCHATEIGGTLARDEELPEPGTALYYVVGWMNRDPESGDLIWHGGGGSKSYRYPQLSCGERLYVDPSAPPGGDGKSWAAAYRSVADAMTHPHTRSASFEVWLRAGGPDTRDITLPRRGAYLLGGFSGSELERWERTDPGSRSGVMGQIRQDEMDAATALWLHRLDVAGEVYLRAGDITEGLVTLVALDSRLSSVTIRGANAARVRSWFERCEFVDSGLATTNVGWQLQVDVLDSQFSETGMSVGFGADISPAENNLNIRRNTFRGSGAGSAITLNAPCFGDSWQTFAGRIVSNDISGYRTGLGLYCCDASTSDDHGSHVTVSVSHNTIVENRTGISCGAVVEDVPGHGILATCEPRVWNNVIAHNTGCAYREGEERHDEEGDTYTDPKEFVTNDLYDNGCMYLDEGTDELNSISEVNALDGSYDNICVPPRFVDRAGGDYHLAPDSPLIDRGSMGAPGAGWIDIDGDPRLLDGDHDGFAWPDIGMDEVP